MNPDLTQTLFDFKWDLRTIFNLLEFFFEAIALCEGLLALVVLRRIHPWHYNFTILIYCLALLCAIYVFAGICIFIRRAYGVDFVLAYDYAMVLRTFSLFGFALGIPAAVTERTAATLLISDYEFRTRRYIPGGIILVVFIVITTTTCARFLYFTTLFPIIAAYFLVNCFALMIFFFIDRRNLRLQRTQLEQPTYSLSERFQLVENIRSCQIIRRGIYVFGIAAIVICIVFIMVLVCQCYSTAIIIVQMTYCSMPVILIGLIAIPFSIDQRWRGELVTVIKSLLCLTAVSRPNTAIEQTTSMNHRAATAFNFNRSEESRLYFEMLQKAWN